MGLHPASRYTEQDPPVHVGFGHSSDHAAGERVESPPSRSSFNSAAGVPSQSLVEYWCASRHVQQRSGRRQPVGDQRADHLAVGEVGTALMAPPVDDAGHAEAFQDRHDQRQSADQVAARAGSRRVKARPGCSSAPESFNRSRRPRFATTRWRTLPSSSR